MSDEAISGEPWDLEHLPLGTVDPADRFRAERPTAPAGAHPVQPPTPQELADASARMRAGVPVARLRLAIEDPIGEYDARVRIDRDTAVRALRRRQAAAVPMARPEPVRERRDGRELLLRLGADPSRGRGIVRCPAHEDRRPSLSWRLADDGRTALVRCFAGCSFAAIVEAAA